MSCLACFAEGESCKLEKDPKFEAEAVACTKWYSDQIRKLGEKAGWLVKELTAGKITSEEYDKEDAINSALHDAGEKLMNHCGYGGYANCKAQNTFCTGIASRQDDHVVV